MTAPIEISVDKLEALTDDFATDGDIDDPANIAHQNVYLFSGRKDITVLSGVVADTAKYLQSFGANTHFDTSQNCAHGFVTNFYGNKCGALASEPFIIDCGYDLAGKILQFIFNDSLNGPLDVHSVPYANVLSLNQSAFVPLGWTASQISVSSLAYAYVASNCSIAPMSAKCRLHVAFHGCQQTLDSALSMGTKFNDTFVRRTGCNAWTETNDLVVLYPQAKVKAMTNPNGCWDWWGYNTRDYAFKNGKQMQMVHNMIDFVINGDK